MLPIFIFKTSLSVSDSLTNTAAFPPEIASSYFSEALSLGKIFPSMTLSPIEKMSLAITASGSDGM